MSPHPSSENSVIVKKNAFCGNRMRQRAFLLQAKQFPRPRLKLG